MIYEKAIKEHKKEMRILAICIGLGIAIGALIGIPLGTALFDFINYIKLIVKLV